MILIVCWVCYFQEAFDYIGSSRMAYDMRKGDMNFTVEDIEMFIEIGQVGLYPTESNATFWLHTGLSESDEVISFIQSAVAFTMFSIAV